MNISIKEFKTISKNQLKGNWKYPVLFTLAYFIFSLFLNFLEKKYFYLGLVAIILSSGISLLVPKFYLEFIKNEGQINLNNLKLTFKQYLKYTLFNIVFGIVSVVIMLPVVFFLISITGGSLIIFSITIVVISIFFTILSLALVLVPYLIIDTDIGIFEICKVSINMMKGYKWTYFIMMLSFIGWAILSILTLGLGFLWLSPYVSITSANFYNQLRKDTLYQI
ncbi:DUF975 family protein [Paraclostridium sordellii 8483]|uniref:DUF975 family protein n=1 Tax=Paraclostridium sordellii TaxID=1505 RepID=UPI000311456C|nr:DUF975 family protein [Paeniclostridium sordellii]TAN67690.1 DUF975 family protein [Paeniclostridium sordellii 8483]CEK36482.1 integral membrane protein,Protein of unknown function (DUF975) [[Clostridium] sordellii] [Paeniclostridium sordellii]